MNVELLNLFTGYLEKQELLSKLTEHEKLHQYGYSEIHTIAAIGNLENPNVTTIAESLHMTRGAISKIIKRLTSYGLIECYQVPDNQQKIFYCLSDTGKFLYEEHEKRHAMWLERDQQFLVQFTRQQLDIITNFMVQYNEYLERKIYELGEDNNVD